MRSLKKIIYGVIYLSLLAFIVFNVLNTGGKNETDEVINFLPLEVLGEIKALSLSSGRTVFFAQVSNPNENYRAEKNSYRFLVYSKNGILIEEVVGEKSFSPREKGYVYEPDVKSSDKEIYRVELNFQTPEWVSVKDLKPELIIRDVKTSIVDGNIKVEGVIENKSPINAEQVRILVVLSNKYYVDLFASETFMGGVPGFEEAAFSISFPEDKALTQNIDPKNTKIFYSGD